MKNGAAVGVAMALAVCCGEGTAGRDVLAPGDSGTDAAPECWSGCGGMVPVPAGVFLQGCNAEVVTECEANETPCHEVDVPAFEIDRYEATIQDYAACVNSGGCMRPRDTTYSPDCNWGVPGRDEHPVNCITWIQAREFCLRVGKRLCTESEWEKASRGVDGRKYPWGSAAATCEYAVMNDGGKGCGTGSTLPVGSRPEGASAYGALDMSGNVAEWVEDDWHASYTGAPTNGEAWVDSPRVSSRVQRGASFGSLPSAMRASFRLFDDPGGGSPISDSRVGVRCCRTP